MADLTNLKDAPTELRVILRPRPFFQVPEARRSDDDAVRSTNNCKRYSTTRRLPCQGGLYVTGGLNRASGNWGQLVEGEVN